MHEMSIAQSLLELVRRHVPEGEWPRVRGVRVRVGRLAGVVPESLTFCFEALAGADSLPGARLEIESIPVTAVCRECRHRFEIDEPVFACAACRSPRIEVLSGDELHLGEIVLDDAPAEVP